MPHAFFWLRRRFHAVTAIVTLAALLVMPLSPLSPHVAQAALTDGLIAQWSFDEGGGATAADSIGSRTGTLTNGATWTTGISGSAVQLDGTDDYVSAGTTALDLTSAVTVSAWVEITGPASNYYASVVSRGEYTYPFWLATYDQDSVHSGIRTSTAGDDYQDIANAFPADNSWHHLVATYDGSSHLIYVDGSLASSKSLSGALVQYGGTLAIGSLGGTNYFFNGAIDEVRIYNRALSATEVGDLYTLESGGTPSTPTPDTQAPTTPTNLTATATSASQINLSWTASTDNVGVTGYRVYRGGSQVATVTSGTTYSDTGLTASTAYSYTVRAYDAANNISSASAAASATTQSASVASYTLTTSAANGTVTKSPDQASYTAGTSVTLTATPNSGYQFSGWSGDASGSTNPLTVTVNANTSITANFTATPQNNGSLVAAIRVLPSTTVEVGEEVYFDGADSTDDKPLIYANLGDPEAMFDWDFGDGYTYVMGTNRDPGEGGIAVSHFFMRPGTYTVTLTVTDVDGNTDAATQQITVTGEAPVAGFELWHAPFTARTAQYLYAQIPSAYRNNSTQLTITISGDTGYSATLLDTTNLSSEETVLLQNASLPAGNYVVEARLLNGSGQQISIVREKFNKSYNGAPAVGINKNNAFVVNGELFFPVTPWLLSESQLDDWKNSGYINTAYAVGYYETQNLTTWQQYLDAANAQGMKVIGPERFEGRSSGDRRNSNPRQIENYINATKNNPAIFGWMWADEPNLGGRYDRVRPATLRAWSFLGSYHDDRHPNVTQYYGYDYLPYYFSSSPTWANEYNFLYDAGKFGGKKVVPADVIGMDIYPKTFGEQNIALTSAMRGSVDLYMEAIDNMIDYNYDLVPAMSFVEVSSNFDVRGRVAPTPDEATMEAWLNVIHGIKAVNWWHYFDPVSAENYAAMATFTDQITRLKDVVLGSEPSRTVTDNANTRGNRVDTMIRETDTDVWVLASRLTEFDFEWNEAPEPTAITANFTVSGLSGAATAEVFDESRTVSVADGVFTDSFDRYATHIYRIPKSGGSPSPGGNDTTPPSRTQGQPTGTLSAGTTATTLSLATNENATCRYGTTAGTSYASMATTFSTTGSTAHSASLTGLSSGSHTYYVRCQDSAGNANTTDYSIQFTTSGDTTPPTRSNGSPASNVPAGTTETTVSLTTSENATCRYSTATETSYAAMTGAFATTGSTSHEFTAANLSDGNSYAYHIRCIDGSGNVNLTDYTVQFDVSADVTPPTLSNGQPGGTLPSNRTETTLTLTTNENATCRYGTTAGTSYANMATTFSTTGGTSHTTNVAGLSSSQTYTYYVRCRDAAGNATASDYAITFAIAAASTPADNPDSSSSTSSGGGGASSGGGGGGGGASSASSEGASTSEDTVSAPSSKTTAPDNVRAITTADGITLQWDTPAGDSFGGVQIVRTTEPLAPDADASAALQAGTRVYEGRLNQFVDETVAENGTYYYHILSYDTGGMYADRRTVRVNREKAAGQEQVIREEQVQTGRYRHLANVDSATVDLVTTGESEEIYDHSERAALNDAETSVYKRVVSAFTDTAEQIRIRLAHFIHAGTATTVRLGAGERGGIVNSFAAAFGRLPQTQNDWQDVIKIGNGRWPSQHSEMAEQRAVETFTTVYRRDPDRTNPHDDAAVTVMAYGLRPVARNFDSEKAAITSFRAIFDRDPVSATDWDTVRAIAYSGAAR